MSMKIIIIFLLFMLFPIYSFAVEYHCEVTNKYNFDKVYTKDEIRKGKFSNKIKEIGNEVFVSRCSYSTSAGKVTCDQYKMDHVEYYDNGLSDKFRIVIKKYYSFGSQFNIQLFQDLSFVEDNGRGGIQYGKCKIVSP